MSGVGKEAFCRYLPATPTNVAHSADETLLEVVKIMGRKVLSSRHGLADGGGCILRGVLLQPTLITVHHRARRALGATRSTQQILVTVIAHRERIGGCVVGHFAILTVVEGLKLRQRLYTRVSPNYPEEHEKRHTVHNIMSGSRGLCPHQNPVARRDVSVDRATVLIHPLHLEVCTIMVTTRA